MEKQSQTLGGQLSNLEDNSDKLSTAFFELAQGPAIALVQAANQLAGSFFDLPAPVQKTVLAVTGFTGVLTVALAAVTAFEVAKVKEKVASALDTAATIKNTVAKQVAVIVETALAVATNRATEAQLAQAGAFGAAALTAGLLAGAIASIALVVDTFGKVNAASESLRDSTELIEGSLAALSEAQLNNAEAGEKQAIAMDLEAAAYKRAQESIGGVQRALDVLRNLIATVSFKNILDQFAKLEAIPKPLRDLITKVANALPEVTTAAEASVNQSKVAFGDLIGSVEGVSQAFDRTKLKGFGKASKEEAQALAKAIDNSIQALEASQPVDQAAAASKKVYLQSLQANKKEIEAVIQRQKEQSQQLADQGSLTDQLQRKNKKLTEELSKGIGGDKQAKELRGVIEQQLSIGQLSAEQAIAQLDAIRKNTKLSSEEILAANQSATKVIQSEAETRVQAVQAEQNRVQALAASGALSQATAEAKLTQLKQKEIEARLKNTQEALARERAEGRGNGDQAQKLIQQEAQLKSQLTQTKGEALKKQNAARIADFSEQQALLESQFAQRVISEQDFNRRSLNIQENRAKEELDQIAAQRAKLSATDKEGLEALAAQEAEVRTRLAKAREDNRKKENEARLRDFSEQQAILEAEFAERTITEQEFNDRSLAIAEERGAEELRQLAAQRKLLAATDKQGLEAIAAQEAEVRARVAKAREDALKKEIERRTRLIEEESAKAADAIQAAETERLTQIQELQNAGGDPQEIERQKLQATRDRINAELEAEKLKLDELRSLPQPNDPKEVATRENTIRDQVQRTAQLRLQQLQNEGQQQELLRQLAIRRIEDQAQAQKIASDRAIAGIEQQKAALERQKIALDTITQSLDRQTKLREAQNNLQSASFGLAGAQANAELTLIQKGIELRQQLNQESDPTKRKAIEQALATLGIQRNAKELDLVKQRQAIENRIAQQQEVARQAELARVRAGVELDLQRNELAARRGLLEAQISEQQARQNELAQQQVVREAENAIAKAKQTVDPRDDIEATAQLEKARQQAVEATESTQQATQNRRDAEKQVEDLPALAQKAREALNLQERSQQIQAESAETIRTITQSLELADAKAASIAGNLAKAAGSAQTIGGGLGSLGGSAIPARRMGGPIEAGQPYLVGEEGPEVVVPKLPGTVLTARQTAALLSPMAIAPALPPVTITPTASIGELKQVAATLQRIEQSLNQPREGMQNNFYNDADPDLTVYKIMRANLRAGR